MAFDADECEEDESMCYGNVRRYCRLAYSDATAPLEWKSRDCGDGVCVDTEQLSFCALGAVSDAVCPTSGIHNVCDGAVLKDCLHGYAIAVDDCGDASLCRDGQRNCDKPGE